MKTKVYSLLVLIVFLLTGCDSRNYSPVEYFGGDVRASWQVEGLGHTTRHFIQIRMRDEGDYVLRFHYYGLGDFGDSRFYLQEVVVTVHEPFAETFGFQFEREARVEIEIEHNGRVESHSF